jgi:hypothetical protein
LSTLFPKKFFWAVFVLSKLLTVLVLGNNGLCTVATKEGTSVNFQSVIALLHQFWGERGCLIAQPYDNDIDIYLIDPPNFRFWILLYERLRQRLRSVQVLDFRFLGYLADPMCL